MLLLLKFICSCTCTRTIAGQQQHETVTAITRTQSILHKLLSVQDVIFPIQQLHMNTSSENINSFWLWVSVCTSSEKLTKRGGISESAYVIWKYELISVLGLSVHFIWKVDQNWGAISDPRVHLIWKLDLILLTIHFTWKVDQNWGVYLKIWTHFEIYSCFTGLFALHTKDLTR